MAFQQTVFECDRPRSVHRGAEWRMDTNAPVTDLVSKTFNHNRAVVWKGSGGFDLFGNVREQVAGGERVEAVPRLELSLCVVRRLHLLLADFAQELADGATQLEWATKAVAVPIRHLAGLSGCGVHDHTVERDVFDAPGGCAEDECLPRPGLVDHLFVEFADARAIGKKHPEEPAIRDGAAVGDRQALRAVASTQRIGDAIPHDARLQISELFARVPSGEQVKHVVAHFVGEFGEVCAALNHRGECSDAHVGVHRDMSHDVLCEHVERVAQISSRFDFGIKHSSRDDGNFEQVVTMLREHLPAAR